MLTRCHCFFPVEYKFLQKEFRDFWINIGTINLDNHIRVYTPFQAGVQTEQLLLGLITLLLERVPHAGQSFESYTLRAITQLFAVSYLQVDLQLQLFPQIGTSQLMYHRIFSFHTCSCPLLIRVFTFTHPAVFFTNILLHQYSVSVQYKITLIW